MPNPSLPASVTIALSGLCSVGRTCQLRSRRCATAAATTSSAVRVREDLEDFVTGRDLTPWS
jgi:hypothetical protein